MYIQITNFRLDDISEDELRESADALAPSFADLPGLVSKYWLANPETNTYGGVYVWQDRQAMEDYKKTEILKGVTINLNFVDVVSKDFAVFEKPTRITRGLSGEVAA